MSGVCPVNPAEVSTTYNDPTPPGTDSQTQTGTPCAVYNSCSCTGGTSDNIVVPGADGLPASTVTAAVECCGVPGPAGPTGPAGADGVGIPSGGLSGQVLAKIDGTDYNTEWVNQTGGGGTGNIVWRGYWQSGVVYLENDFVTHNGTSYVCQIDHTSDTSSEPDPVFDYEGGTYWIVSSVGTEAATMNKLVEDSTSWFDGVVDWLGDMENWDMDDVAKLIFGGAGLYFAGQVVNDIFTVDPVGDGAADSTYSGDALYSGTYNVPTLAQTISNICDLAGITSYDVSDLPTIEVNFTIGNFSSARTILELLSRVYFFDMVDSGGVLKFVNRGSKTPVKTLTRYEDLGYVAEGTPPAAPINVKRYQGIDLPRKVSLTYNSAESAHNKYEQHATLETFDGGQDVKLDVPITLTDQEAYDIAEAFIVNAHIERTTYAFTTTYKNIELEPGDVITVEGIGDVRILRIDEQQEGGLLTFVCSDASFNVDSYTSSGIASSSPVAYTDAPVALGYSSGIAAELPPLDSSDTQQRITLAPHGYGKSGWPGCNVYYSTDSGVSYSLLTSVTKEATWGRVATATPAVTDPDVWDETTTITVELKTGSLSSYTDLDVLNGINWALIGQEIIGFKTATFLGGTSYELSGLLRGRRGTDYYIDQHNNVELFTLLDDALVEFPYPIDAKDSTFMFKFVTIGSDISKATAITAQPDLKSRRPWTVANLDAVRTGNDWNITWTGRNQFDGEMVDNHPVLNPDGFGGFIIQVTEPGSPETIKRSVIQQVTGYTYTEAQQIADFGSVQSNITIRVSQIDLTVGPGYNKKTTF